MDELERSVVLMLPRPPIDTPSPPLYHLPALFRGRRLAEICREKHMAALLVSHDLSVVSCLCSRVMVLYQAVLVEEGPVRRVIDAPEEEYTKKLISSVLEVE